ncbi:uncharacterized protein LOC115439285 [Sphaeramia orbicularis]|uniref:uncharacterized protein LOC115439285 n=1 Tax=Sphaeramia orbicularis TaxID=375764 RepID=UPI00117FF7F4|nr:uncharacterized protein LOC115439285 [Sphaeramia orbicularis]
MANVSLKELLLDTLEELNNEEFMEFKWFLKFETRHGFRPIPVHRLEHADRMDTVDRVVQNYDLKAVEISVAILQKMHQNQLVMKLTEVNSKDEVKTTVCHFQTNNTATDGGIVFNPNISDCRINTLNINVSSRVTVGELMADQSYHQTFVPSPERPLRVFPAQVCSVLNVLRGQVDEDDLFLLRLKEQLKNLEPRKKSLMMLKFQEMIHEALFDSDAP